MGSSYPYIIIWVQLGITYGYNIYPYIFNGYFIPIKAYPWGNRFFRMIYLVLMIDI